MKRMKWLACWLVLLGAAPAAASGDGIPYGYTPLEADSTERTAVGQGENAYYEVAFCLDPETDPAWKRLKGAQIVGVRCFLNYEYRQKSKKFSAVNVYHGSLDGTVESTLVNFEEGWNELMLDQPVTVGDEKLYVAARVFELLSAPYPFATYEPAREVFYVNANKEGWEERTEQGGLMMQVLVEADGALLAHSARAQLTEVPVAVKRDGDFGCKLYVHNFSTEPLEQLTVRTQSDGMDRTVELELGEAIGPHEGKVIDAVLHAGETEGRAREMTLTAAMVNGQTADETKPDVRTLYVSEQVYKRIPLVEEFTGLACVNCPFMAYYLDVALEEFGAPYVYVAHHAGYVEDMLTQEVDRQLLYLFGEEATYNPAVMYDRRMFEGAETVVHGAREASHEPYLAMLQQTMLEPAEAEVLVHVDEQTDGTWACRVEGEVSNLALMDGPFRVSTFLVEDSLTTEDYPQAGMDTPGAPEDLADRFRHNGVIRHVFSEDPQGDMVMSESNSFSLYYDAVTPEADWNLENCHVVAVVHRRDEANLAGNWVLNAGDNRLNEVVDLPEPIRNDVTEVRVFCGRDRILQTDGTLHDLEVYAMNGMRVRADGPLEPGIYWVRATTETGELYGQKLWVP